MAPRALILLLLAACSPSLVDARDPVQTQPVVSGRPGTRTEIGATVSLVAVGGSFCTGTLVAPRVVVTAAHCLVDLPISIVEVVAGSLSPADEGQRLAVASLTPHPEFSMSGVPTDDEAGLSDERDIGVIVLAQDASVAPAPVVTLGGLEEALVDGATTVIIAGYGLTSVAYDADYGRLYVAQTPFVRRGPSEFLAGGPGTPDTCNGDSGGPAYVERDGELHLAGITSRGAFSEQGDECGSGGIYTLFAAFEAFVEEASGGLYDGSGGSVDLPPPPPPPEGAGSCANSCDEGVAPDQACYCDPYCATSGDCCDDFAAACPDMPTWSCTYEELADEECDCGCGAPDFACGDDECPSAPPPAEGPVEEPADALPASEDEPPLPQASCAAMGTSGAWLAIVALGSRVPQRRKRRDHTALADRAAPVR